MCLGQLAQRSQSPLRDITEAAFFMRSNITNPQSSFYNLQLGLGDRE